MQGSRPLPDAKHTFPASPNIFKFWGTPLSKNYFRGLSLYLAYSAAIVGINYYLTRNDDGEFGFVCVRPYEEVKGLLEAGKFNATFDNLGLNVHQRHRDMLGWGKDPSNPNVVFDDGIDFVPPEEIYKRNTVAA